MQDTRKKEVAGVVVLYNPDDAVLTNINSYVQQVDVLYVVDNSDIENAQLTAQLTTYPNVSYINNNGNNGIAFALNRGIDEAVHNGYQWLLTMDQDTKLPKNAVAVLYDFAKSRMAIKVGIVSPKHFIDSEQFSEDFRQVNFTMTSGNLVNLNSIPEVGKFLDDLFIDHVDHEFCFRLGRAGYQIFESYRVKIEHQLGEKIIRKILGYTIEVKGHSPFRLYYMTRNGLIVAKMYPEQKDFAKHVRSMIMREIIKSVLFYRMKARSINAIFRGYMAFKRSNCKQV